jgi:transcriptional regulator with XRE-family HTH domain
MPDLKKLFGAHVRHARKARGLTQANLAELCDLSLDMVGRMERGEIAPSFGTIERLSAALAISVAGLFGGQPIIEADSPERERAFTRILGRLGPLSDRDLEWIDRVLVAMLRR